MRERIETAKAGTNRAVLQGEFAAQVEMALNKSKTQNKPFFVVLVQIDQLDAFRQRRGDAEANALIRELLSLVRKALHPSQYAGAFRNGLGLVFDTVDVGHVDLISRRLVGLCQQAIRLGKYNDPSPSWGDLLMHMLVPSRTPILAARAGWSIYPRDGMTPSDLVTRAVAHLQEQAR